jgi:ubiquinone biosynthesis protein
MNQRKRLEDIAKILVNHGFEKVVKEIVPITARLMLRGLRPQIRQDPVYVRLREALSDLGPTFIKFGQYMRTRPDLLPPDLIEELEQLSDKTDPIPYSEIEKIIEGKLGSVEALFIEINKEPLSSGSISQKHVATLRGGGKVVLKIKRPEVSEAIETDLDVLAILAKNSGKISDELKLFNFPDVVEDFSQEIRKELDFISEGKSAELISKEMEAFVKVRIPKIYWELTNEDILVIEYIDGVMLDRVEEIAAMGVNTKELAYLCFHAYMTQIFTDGFFHGDPDPGNLMVTRGGELVFIDFGLMGVLRQDKRDMFIRLTSAVFENDVDDIVRSMQGLGLWGGSGEIELLKDDIYVALKEHKLDTKYSGDNKFSLILAEVRKRDLSLPMQSVLTFNTLLKMNSNVKMLFKDFNLVEEMNSAIGEMLRKRVVELVNLKKTGLSLMDTMQNTKDLPQHMNDALRTIVEGPIRFKLDYDNLDNLSESVNKATYMVLMAVALIVLSFQNVTLYGFPVSTVLTYVLALSLGAISIYNLFLNK